MPPLDTSPEIEEMQIKKRRAMTPAECLQSALDISLFARELRKAGIRRAHPDWNDRQIMIELFRLACFPDPLPHFFR